MVSHELLPTPSKSHYLFNTRDLSKIVQGLLQAKSEYYDSKESMLQLWLHELFRIIGDRMWDSRDQQWLREKAQGLLKSAFETDWEEVFPCDNVPPFVNFTRDVEDPPYEAVVDLSKLKKQVSVALEDYGLEPGNVPMDLVLFKDALHHLCRIHRLMSQPRGHALLVGMGGSGRKSLTKLAAYIAQQQLFTIEITKNYREVYLPPEWIRGYRNDSPRLNFERI